MKTLMGYAVLAALVLPGLAHAVPEVEDNNPVADGQSLEITNITVDGKATTGATVDGVVGNVTGPMVQDLDFFSFTGKTGDLVTIDIDGGFGGLRNLDSILALFGPAPGYALLIQMDDTTVDPGSMARADVPTRTRDARIDAFRLPADGTYTVGVSGFPQRWSTSGGGKVNSIGLSTQRDGGETNGDYTLIISGVTRVVMQISIDIKPGSSGDAPINPKAHGKIPVALLGASDFIVDDVDVGKLTFGHSGNEASLAKCGTASDVNGDAFPDLVCHFENQAAHFDSTDGVGILRGTLDNGGKFEGRGWLKVVPVKD